MNHLPDTGKMVSDTPRTDARVRRMIDNDHSPEGLEYWARELERELNAANDLFRKLNIHSLDLADRIRRLEEAGDRMSHTCVTIDADRWRKAKEDKP